MKIKCIYGAKQVATSGCELSPSAEKPKLFAEYLQKHNADVEFVEPEPITTEDILKCHYPIFVNDVLTLKRRNGFGTYSQSVVDSLPYTNGAMYTGAWLALKTRQPTCAFVSGFHHAGYDGFEKFGYFCTFNGLVIAGKKLIDEDNCNKIAIVDCDCHHGNGTEDILKHQKWGNEFIHLTFGQHFNHKRQAKKYLDYFKEVKQVLFEEHPDVILYQSGADVHENDPFGGFLTEEQMYERDILMFTIAKDLDIPICWNLAGGYQRDKDGSCNYVLKLHANTFDACLKVYNGNTSCE